jgi:hypothetical protein
MTTAKAKGLHAKLAEVMAEAERIPKNGTYPGQGNWKYVLVGDAADAIRKALGERGVSMLPSAVEVVGESEYTVKSGTAMSLMTVRTTWTLTDGETGETATIQSIGSGADAGDKASPKAQTNAMKYALLMGFLLSTGDDPEQHDTSDRQSRTEGTETTELLGRVDVQGKAAPGGAGGYKGEYREAPDGYSIGFKLARPDDKSIPQVLIVGATATALRMADPGASFMGSSVHVKGRLYAVKTPGRTTYNRLIVGEAEGHFIETDDWRIPAETPSSEPEPGAEVPAPVAPGQEEAFDLSDQALGVAS